MDNEEIKKNNPVDRYKIRELEQELEIKNEFINALEEQKKEPSHDSSAHGRRELEQENQMLNELLESFEGKELEDIEKFFSMISHELKTPLVPIQSYVKLLKEGRFGSLDETQKEKLGLVASNAGTLSKLIQNMLDYQKLSSGTIKMKKEENNLENIVNDSFDYIASEFKQKEIEKTFSIEGNIELICDGKRISQVLTNLLENSLDAIQPRLGTIEVAVSQSENSVKITVHDNGCGIPKEKLDKVFSKFYQVDMSNTREKGGVGLGLSICKKIIDAHDGKIWIESELGQETTIHVSLPKK